MSFLQYIERKKYFLLFYVVLMFFITIMIIVTIKGDHLVENILYINLGCGLLGSTYIIVGYFYRNSFYKELHLLINDNNAAYANILRPQNHEQILFLELLNKLNHDHIIELEKYQNEKMDYQDFIMSWVHEVKLPITASKMLIKNSSDKTVDYLADKFEDEINKIDNYVEQALYYSRVDAFSKDYFITEVSLNQVIKESIKKYSKLFINKHIRFSMWDTEKFVYSDSKWLGFIIDQALTNSLKYTNDGGSISFEYEENVKERLLIIQDTGIGINAEDINRVFEKGFTGSIGRNYKKSTGMGLYLAKQLAIKLGHDISIQSEEGKFARVIIHFPKISNYFHLYNEGVNQDCTLI